MRRAASRRIVSPLSIGFSTIAFTSAAYSLGRPRRCGWGTSFASAARTSAGRPASIGVSKMPGAIVITRICWLARSRAIGSVMPTTPPFEAAYAAWPIWPSKAATLAVLTITPRSPSTGSCAAMRAAATRIVLKVPIRLIVITRENCSSGSGPSREIVRPAVPTPAQLTTMCRPPSCSNTAATAAVICSPLVTSAGVQIALPRPALSSVATCWPGWLDRSTSATAAPFSTSSSAVARPSPEAPPVISAALPLMFILPLSVLSRARPGNEGARNEEQGKNVPSFLVCAGRSLDRHGVGRRADAAGHVQRRAGEEAVVDTILRTGRGQRFQIPHLAEGHAQIREGAHVQPAGGRVGGVELHCRAVAGHGGDAVVPQPGGHRHARVEAGEGHLALHPLARSAVGGQVVLGPAAADQQDVARPHLDLLHLRDFLHQLRRDTERCSGVDRLALRPLVARHVQQDGPAADAAPRPVLDAVALAGAHLFARGEVVEAVARVSGVRQAVPLAGTLWVEVVQPVVHRHAAGHLHHAVRVGAAAEERRVGQVDAPVEAEAHPRADAGRRGLDALRREEVDRAELVVLAEEAPVGAALGVGALGKLRVTRQAVRWGKCCCHGGAPSRPAAPALFTVATIAAHARSRTPCERRGSCRKAMLPARSPL